MVISHIKAGAAALLLAGFTCSAPVLAQTPSATASVSNLSWQLIDLNPGDGIAPEISFFGQAFHSQAGYALPWSVTDSRSSNLAGNLTLAADRVSLQAGSDVNAVHASAGLTTGREFGSAGASSYFSTKFRLTPHTGVLFSAQAELAAETSGPGSNGWALALLSADVNRLDSSSGNSFFEEDVHIRNDTLSYVLRGYVHSGALANDGELLLSTRVEANTWNATSPVPEPASAAMLLAGLALVGAMAMRRRRALRMLTVGLALVSTAPAFAQSLTASAEVSGLHYELIDLNLADGIDPSVDFYDYAFVNSAEYTGHMVYQSERLAEAGSVAVEVANAGASASSDADRVRVSGQYSVAEGYNRVSSESERGVSFRLAPYTGIVFSATSTLSAAIDGPVDTRVRASLTGWVEALEVQGGSLYFGDYIDLRTSGERSYLMSAFGHAGAAGGSGKLFLTSAINAYHFGPPPPPVPEPASAAMLLAGLALVRAAVARRKGRTRA